MPTGHRVRGLVTVASVTAALLASGCATTGHQAAAPSSGERAVRATVIAVTHALAAHDFQRACDLYTPALALTTQRNFTGAHSCAESLLGQAGLGPPGTPLLRSPGAHPEQAAHELANARVLSVDLRDNNRAGVQVDSDGDGPGQPAFTVAVRGPNGWRLALGFPISIPVTRQPPGAPS